MPQWGMGILSGSALQQRSPGAEVVQIHSGNRQTDERPLGAGPSLCKLVHPPGVGPGEALADAEGIFRWV